MVLYKPFLLYFRSQLEIDRHNMSASSPPSEAEDPRSNAYNPVHLLFGVESDEDDDIEFHPAPGDSQEEEDDGDASYHGADR